MKIIIKNLCERFQEEIDFSSEVQIFMGMYELQKIKTMEDVRNYYLICSKNASCHMNEKDFLENVF